MSVFQKIELFYYRTSVSDKLAILLTFLLIGFTIIDPIFYQLSTHANDFIKDFSRYISDFGRSAYILIPSGIIFLVSLFLINRAPSLKLGAAYRQFCQMSGFVFFAVAGSGLIALGFKNLLGRARPRHFEEFGSTYFAPLTFDPSFASFPSGHSTTSFAFAVAFCLMFPKLRFTAISLALWIALSRYLIGAHYMTDIIVGSALGSCFAIYAKRFFTRQNILFKEKQDEQTRLQGGYVMRWFFMTYLSSRLALVFNNILLSRKKSISKVIIKNIRL